LRQEAFTWLQAFQAWSSEKTGRNWSQDYRQDSSQVHTEPSTGKGECERYSKEDSCLHGLYTFGQSDKGRLNKTACRHYVSIAGFPALADMCTQSSPDIFPLHTASRLGIARNHFLAEGLSS